MKDQVPRNIYLNDLESAAEQHVYQLQSESKQLSKSHLRQIINHSVQKT